MSAFTVPAWLELLTVVVPGREAGVVWLDETGSRRATEVLHSAEGTAALTYLDAERRELVAEHFRGFTVVAEGPVVNLPGIRGGQLRASWMVQKNDPSQLYIRLGDVYSGDMLLPAGTSSDQVLWRLKEYFIGDVTPVVPSILRRVKGLFGSKDVSGTDLERRLDFEVKVAPEKYRELHDGLLALPFFQPAETFASDTSGLFLTTHTRARIEYGAVMGSAVFTTWYAPRQDGWVIRHLNPNLSQPLPEDLPVDAMAALAQLL